jgi:hypothetical protein
MGITLARLFTLAGVGMPTFSFSPSSLGAGLSLIFLADADIFILACSKAVLDARRCIPGVVGIAGGLLDEERASEDDGLVFNGVGVPIETRPCFRGGGPIEAVADLATVEPFVRMLLPRDFVAVPGVSIPRMLSLPVSESADGGLTIPGVTIAADESRRCAIFDG